LSEQNDEEYMESDKEFSGESSSITDLEEFYMEKSISSSSKEIEITDPKK
jgi:hypothetical protein